MIPIDAEKFTTALCDIAWRFKRATSEEEREALRKERAEVGEAYREWHLQKYGWAYGSY